MDGSSHDLDHQHSAGAKAASVDYSDIKRMPIHLIVSIAASRDGLISPALMRAAGTEPELQEDEVGEFSEVMSIWRLNASRPLLPCELRWVRVAQSELVARIVARGRRRMAPAQIGPT
jgi:hypothetical protein